MVFKVASSYRYENGSKLRHSPKSFKDLTPNKINRSRLFTSQPVLYVVDNNSSASKLRMWLYFFVFVLSEHCLRLASCQELILSSVFVEVENWKPSSDTLCAVCSWFQIQLCNPHSEPFSRFQRVKLWTGCGLGTLSNQSERERYNQMSLFECLVNERSNRRTRSERAFITDRVPAWPQTPNNSSWIWPRLLKTFDMERLQSQLCLSTME